MKVKRNTLLLLAALVWGIAGANILRIGLAAYPAYLTLWNTLLSVLVFAVFQQAVFGKLVKKHTSRIGAYPDERLFFLRFFDRKSFVIMAVMMTGGILVCGPAALAPEAFIAIFYTGLGASLLLGWTAVRSKLRQSCFSGCLKPYLTIKRRIHYAGYCRNSV